MNKAKIKIPLFYQSLLLMIVSALFSSCSSNNESTEKRPLLIQEQGSFTVGGTVISNPGTFDPYNPTPEGQTFRGDHAYVFYQIPAEASKYPLVMWHGIGQFSKTWETTPDGREGFQTSILRRGFRVYLIDQPRRGNAGRSRQKVLLHQHPMNKNGLVHSG